MIDLKALPVDIETERLVIGALLIDPEAVPLTIHQLEAEDFATEAHRRLWLAIGDLYELGEPVDRATVGNRLRDKGHLESVGGYTYLVTLDDGLPQVYALDAYVRRVKQISIRRRVAVALAQTAEALCAPGASEESVEHAERLVRDINAESQATKRQLRGLGDHVAAAGGIAEFLRPSKIYTVPLPWPAMRSTIPGFGPGRLYIVAARPGVGKSIALGEIALHAAVGGQGAAVFSLEMSADETWRRLIARETGIPLTALNNGYLTAEQSVTANRCSGMLAELPLWIDDQANLTVAAIVGGVRRALAAGCVIGVVCVDYLQLVSATRKRTNRAEDVSEISRGLKLAAKELKLPVVAACQMNRDAEKENREPQLRDLRESGSIEQDADVVMFIHRDPQRAREAIQMQLPIPTEFLIRKQRNGPTGRATLNFHPNIVRFE